MCQVVLGLLYFHLLLHVKTGTLLSNIEVISIKLIWLIQLYSTSSCSSSLEGFLYLGFFTVIFSLQFFCSSERFWYFSRAYWRVLFFFSSERFWYLLQASLLCFSLFFFLFFFDNMHSTFLYKRKELWKRNIYLFFINFGNLTLKSNKITWNDIKLP